MFHSPFRGRGILGAGVHRQTISRDPSCFWAPAALALGESCMPSSAPTALMAEARFLGEVALRGVGEPPAVMKPAPVLNCLPKST